MPHIIQKVEPRTGYKLILGRGAGFGGHGAQVKRIHIDEGNILKIVALERTIRKCLNIVADNMLI
jgi:hypothetical protein